MEWLVAQLIVWYTELVLIKYFSMATKKFLTQSNNSAKSGIAAKQHLTRVNIVNLVNSDGCFDLQFRKDTRHERTNSPTYYRWKVQFVVTAPKNNIKILQKIKREIGCGEINISKDQARFSVQKIDNITSVVVPFFKKNLLAEKKKKDFELWSKGVEIIQRNKGKYLTDWKKNELLSLIEIQKSSAKYKNRPRQPKWLEMAKTLSRTN